MATQVMGVWVVKEIVSVPEKPRDTIKASETMGVAAVSMLKGR